MFSFKLKNLSFKILEEINKFKRDICIKSTSLHIETDNSESIKKMT